VFDGYGKVIVIFDLSITEDAICYGIGRMGVQSATT
jgi:hypothetical protein